MLLKGIKKSFLLSMIRMLSDKDSVEYATKNYIYSVRRWNFKNGFYEVYRRPAKNGRALNGAAGQVVFKGQYVELIN